MKIMKKRQIKSWILIIGILVVQCVFPCFSQNVFAEEVKEKELRLYAKSAVLMDAESGRVLYEKNGSEILAMASTTKIMTCILALENGKMDDVVTISKYASTMPDVQLNIRENETYYLKDLLHSLMLESHNDSAVAIAEHISGSVEEFARLMNEKAVSLGCTNTHFITPNGLDKEDEGGIHSTTAVELAMIMRYCISQSPKKEEFLEITRTSSYSFEDIEGNRSFSINNHNAFLNMMEGALSGKTGFTAKAGYCYIGSLRKDGKTFIVALLACGWPNNKTYKWSDTKVLMNYGLDNYNFKSYDEIPVDESKLEPILVERGQTSRAYEKAMVSIEIQKEASSDLEQGNGLLVKEGEEIEIVYKIQKKLAAPVQKGTVVGTIQYQIGDMVFEEKKVVTCQPIEKINYKWCFQQIFELFLI